LYGAMSGAKIAITAQAPITARPTRASGLRHGTGVTGRSRRRPVVLLASVTVTKA
jgi:hypothetical protein